MLRPDDETRHRVMHIRSVRSVAVLLWAGHSAGALASSDRGALCKTGSSFFLKTKDMKWLTVKAICVVWDGTE
jgi:hypothetical protein